MAARKPKALPAPASAAVAAPTPEPVAKPVPKRARKAPAPRGSRAATEAAGAPSPAPTPKPAPNRAPKPASQARPAKAAEAEQPQGEGAADEPRVPNQRRRTAAKAARRAAREQAAAEAAGSPPAPHAPPAAGPGRPTLLTPDRHRDIVELIRAGAFDWVAAEACGIARETFFRWVRRGERAIVADVAEGEPEWIYRSFAEDVRMASAFARVTAEIEVKAADVKWWLSRGPGKTKPGRPGWTETVIIDQDGAAGARDDDTLTSEEKVARVARNAAILDAARSRQAAEGGAGGR